MHVSLCSVLATFLAPSFPSVIAVTGAGGKTTVVCTLARYFREEGRKVLVSTTTKMQHPSSYDYGCTHVFFDDSVLGYKPKEGEICFFAREYEPGKVSAPSLETLAMAGAGYDVVLLEADGARCLPLKLHTKRDPVIPSSCTAVLAVLGLSAVGQDRSSSCFGELGEGLVDMHYLQGLLDDPQGVCKGFSAQRRCMILANQFESLEVTMQARTRELHASAPLVFGSLHLDTIY